MSTNEEIMRIFSKGVLELEESDSCGTKVPTLFPNIIFWTPFIKYVGADDPQKIIHGTPNTKKERISLPEVSLLTTLPAFRTFMSPLPKKETRLDILALMRSNTYRNGRKTNRT
jgi:hypothetical protein